MDADRDLRSTLRCQPDEARTYAISYAPKPTAADLGRTEISVFCDPLPVERGSPGPNQPNN